MRTRNKKFMLIYAGMFLGPLVVIRMIGGSVAVSHAASATNVEPAVSAAMSARSIGFGTPERSEQQQAALSYVEQIADRPFGDFPFVYRTLVQDVEAPVVRHGLSVRINAIMNSSTGPSAMIDGSLVRVGDLVSGGRWIIQDIDPDGRTVKFREVDTGRLVSRTVTPGS